MTLTCSRCGLETETPTAHLRTAHNVTPEEYEAHELAVLFEQVDQDQHLFAVFMIPTQSEDT